MQKTEVVALENERQSQIPAEMRAAVYRGQARISVEQVPVPEIGDEELLVRVHSCGVCGTDLKKIEKALVPPPRIFGHEIAGTVVRAGEKATRFAPGDRVALHHHIPCRRCFYCLKKLFSQCEFYRRTGTTAGFEPAGGGFAEYVRVMDWIVKEGTVLIPDGVSCEEASFLEPLNTCLKALETASLEPGETVVVFGQGPVGLLMMQAAASGGARVVGLDLMDRRLELSRELGACKALNPIRDDVASVVRSMTEGRGADLAVVATADHGAIQSAQSLVRRGGRVLLFAQTVPGEMITIDASRICMEEKQLIGSYSASVELQAKAARLIFTREVNVARLVTHRFALDLLPEGIRLASHPTEDSLKVIIQP
ncbi:MAG TPA: alcohol dehydrogenase catalytic domain-containing protein [Acidobacteriota bacterium]|nr:alcohol dehydrogenase catalytic domain-containing protein [Acidobacteriota bacterium]